MAKDNEKWGSSPGPYKGIQGFEIPIKLIHTGLNTEDGPRDIAPGEAVDMSNLRITRGGIAPEYALTRFPVNDNDPLNSSAVLHVTSFEKSDGTKIVVRMKADTWEYFLGAQFVPLAGSVGGLAGKRLYSTVMDDLLIAANGQTILKSWDGNIGHPVQNLSAEAPRARFITRLGQRLFAANLTFIGGADLNQDEIAWSADGDIMEWTDTSLGAGGLRLKPEGTPSLANNITGLSNIERGTLIYRQRSLVLASRTGVRAAPFRFATIDFAHGTESPYSIASGGLLLGDFFLGFDAVVYHFDGVNPPVPIGLPIQTRLKERITSLKDCIGFINPVTMEYYLLSPTINAEPPVLGDAHIFSIRDYLRKQKLSWRYRPLAETVTTAAYVPRVSSTSLPFVDSLNTILDVVDPTNSPVHNSSIVPVEVAQVLGLPIGIYSGFTGNGLKPNVEKFTFTQTSDSALPDAAGEPPRIVKRIRACRLAGKKVILMMTGGHSRFIKPKPAPATGTMFDSGNYSVSGSLVGSPWANVMDTYNTAVIKAEVALGLADGTIMGADMFDEPQHVDWGDAITKAIMDECARYVKRIFPGMPCGASVLSQYHPSERYSVLDFIQQQWVQIYESGTPGNHPEYGASITGFRDYCLAHAEPDKVKLVLSLNIANGGAGYTETVCPIPPTGGFGVSGGRCSMGSTNTIAYPNGMIQYYGTAMLAADAAGRRIAALNMWSFEAGAVMSAYMANAANQASFLALKAIADALPYVDLRRLP